MNYNPNNDIHGLLIYDLWTRVLANAILSGTDVLIGGRGCGFWKEWVWSNSGMLRYLGILY